MRAGGCSIVSATHGGFALRLARNVPEAEALDISADAVDADSRERRSRNGVPHLQAREVNVFDELRRLERAGARYDTIVLDPPAFAKNKASIPNAMAGLQGDQPPRDAAAQPGRAPRSRAAARTTSTRRCSPR